MQSSTGNYSMCHQVPIVSLLLLVYLSAVSYISVRTRGRVNFFFFFFFCVKRSVFDSKTIRKNND